MEEIRVKLPESLKGEKVKLEKEVAELISSEEKTKLLSLFLDNALKNAQNVSDKELVELGRKIKRGRIDELKNTGLIK